MNRYYTTLRPVSIGTVPNAYNNKIQEFENYDIRTEVKGHMVWGYVEYKQPLSDDEIKEYELLVI